MHFTSAHTPDSLAQTPVAATVSPAKAPTVPTIEQQTGWRRRMGPVAICQDSDVLASVSQYDFDLSDAGFCAYAEARGVLYKAGFRTDYQGRITRRWQATADHTLTLEQFCADPHFQFAEEYRGKRYRYTPDEMDAQWRILRIVKGALQDCWQIFRATEGSAWDAVREFPKGTCRDPEQVREILPVEEAVSGDSPTVGFVDAVSKSGRVEPAKSLDLTAAGAADVLAPFNQSGKFKQGEERPDGEWGACRFQQSRSRLGLAPRSTRLIGHRSNLLAAAPKRLNAPAAQQRHHCPVRGAKARRAPGRPLVQLADHSQGGVRLSGLHARRSARQLNLQRGLEVAPAFVHVRRAVKHRARIEAVAAHELRMGSMHRPRKAVEPDLAFSHLRTSLIAHALPSVDAPLARRLSA